MLVLQEKMRVRVMEENVALFPESVDQVSLRRFLPRADSLGALSQYMSVSSVYRSVPQPIRVLSSCILNPIVAPFPSCELLLASCDSEYVAFTNSQEAASLTSAVKH